MTTFAASADAVNSGVLRARTLPVIALPVAAPVAPVAPPAPALPVRPQVAAPGSVCSWWWLALIAAGGYWAWRRSRRARR